jgi:hypothetical protein
MKIRKVHAVLDISSYTTTAVDISASLPDLSEPGEGVSFAFDGTQDVAFSLGNSDKSLYVQLCDAEQRIDFGPFDADWLRSQGQTYLWASGSATAGNVSILLVSER